MKQTILTAVTVITLIGMCVSAEQAPKVTEKIQEYRPEIEVVFVLDTTGSMSGLIEAAKQKIWSIANTFVMTEPAPKIKMGLVGYRDRGDSYVTKHFSLTDDIDAVYTFLMGFSANGGGDTPESVNQALHEAVTKMQWSDDEDTYKVIFLVGDCPPHMDYADDIKFPETCKLAVTKGIAINTIQCGNHGHTTPIWQQIAKSAEGQFFRVDQGGSAIVEATPYDDNLADLSRRLDGTRLYYGSEDEIAGKYRRAEEAEMLYNSAPASAIASRAKFNSSKSGEDNFAAGQELVMDVENGKVDLDKLEEDKLDERLRKMTLDERKGYVAKKAVERSEIQKQIEEISKKRQQYIQQKISKKNLNEKDSLDKQLYECIKTQAAQKNIEYTDGPVY